MVDLSYGKTKVVGYMQCFQRLLLVISKRFDEDIRVKIAYYMHESQSTVNLESFLWIHM